MADSDDGEEFPTKKHSMKARNVADSDDEEKFQGMWLTMRRLLLSKVDNRRRGSSGQEKKSIKIKINSNTNFMSSHTFH